MQRFAHAHHDNIGDVVARLRQFAGKIEHLRHDFAGGQIAEEAHLPGGAEDAAHGAAGLGADAEGAPLFVFHEHGFDEVGRRAVERALFWSGRRWSAGR